MTDEPVPAPPEPAPAPDAPEKGAGASDPTATGTRNALRLQRVADSGRNAAVPDPEAKKTVEIPAPAIPPMTPEELASVATSTPGAARPIQPDVFVPRTKMYDVSLTRRLETDPELVRALSEPGFATPPLPLPRPPGLVPPTNRLGRAPVSRIQALLGRVPARLRPDPAKLRKRLIVALVAVLAIRLGVALALDFVLDVVCRELIGLECSVGRSSLRLLSGEAVFEGLELRTPGGQPIATVGRAELHVQWTELPTIVIHRAVVEDATVTLRRESDGTIPALTELEELIEAKIRKKRTSSPPRVVLEAVRLTHGRLAWEDLSTTPQLRETVELEARADDLALDGSARTRPARVSVRLAAPGILDAFRLDAAARPDGEARIVDLQLALEGHPRLLASYLAPHVRPAAREVSLDLQGRLVARPILLDGEEGETADLTVEKVSLKADQEELGFDQLVASARKLSRDAIEVSSIVVDRPRASLARLTDGALAIGGFAFPPHEDAEEPRARHALELPDLVVDEVAVHGGRFHFVDETTAPRVDLLAHDLDATLREVVKDARRPWAKAQLDASVSVDGVVDSLKVAGAVTPFGAPRRANVELDARGITLRGLDPWLARAGLASSLARGSLAAKLAGSVAERGETLGLEATLSDLVLDDSGERAGISAVRVAGASYDRASGDLAVKSIAIEGPRARVERGRDGVLSFLGLRTLPRAPEPAAAVASSSAPSHRSDLVRHVAIDRVALEGGGCVFHDEALGAPVELALEEGAVTVRDVAFDTSATTAAAPPARLSARARLAPGLGSVDLEAVLVADPAAPELSGTLTATDLGPGPLAPYLARAGIEPALIGGRLAAHVEAQARARGIGLEQLHVVVEGLSLASPTAELAAVDRLELEGGAVRPIERRIELGSLAIEGARARVVRRAGGAVDAVGLRFVPRPAGARDAEAAPAPGEGEPLPHVHWGPVALSNAALEWRDEAVSPPAAIRVERLDAKIGAHDFDRADVPGLAPHQRFAPFELHARAEGVFAALDLEGELVASRRAPALAAALHVKGVTLAALTPYLAPRGIAPALVSGELDARVEAQATIDPASVHARALVSDLSCRDGASPLGSLAEAALTLDFDRVARRLALSGARLEGARLAVERTRDGGLSLLGLSFGDAPATPSEPGRAAAEPAASSPPLAVRLDGVHVGDLAVHFDDAAALAHLDLDHGSLELGASGLGAGAASSPFTLHAAVQGVGELDLAGGVRLDSTAPSISASLALRHLGGTALAPYLREHGSLLLADGALDAFVRLGRERSPEGATAYHAAVDRLELREGERRLLAWRALRVHVPRADASALEVDELAVGGIEGQLELLPGGRVRVAGFELAPRRAAPEPVAQPGEVDEDAVAARLRPLPSTLVQGLGLGIDRLLVYDRTGGAEAPPFEIEDATLSQPWPFALTRESRASGFLVLFGSLGVKDVLRRAAVELHLVPFDSEPHAALVVSLDGFSGPALMKRAPELAARLDPSALTQASLRAYATIDLKNRRRLDALLADPKAVPLSFDAALEDVEMRGTPDGPVLLGLDELHVDVTGWSLGTGEVRLRAIDIANPRGRIRKEKDGLRILDTLWKPAPPAAEGAAASAAPPGPELKIDRIAATDGDILFEDGSVMPEVSIPLGGLELELTGFSSRVLRERRPLRVSLAARSGAAFDELSAHGSLTLFPEIDGDLDALLTGLRIARLSGYTKREWNMKIVDGRLDLDARARARSGRISLPVHIALADANVDESDGPSEISRRAAISVPTALSLIHDDDGVVALPIQLQNAFHGLEPLGKWDVPGAVGTAIALAVKGIVSKPLGAIEDVGKSITEAVVGREEEESRIAKVAFVPGDSRLPHSKMPELDRIAARLKGDDRLRVSLRAEIGADDEARAKRLGLPTPEERRDLIARLEARRRRLETRREDAAAEVRAALLSGAPDEIGPARARHSRAARAVEEADRSLDALYDQERTARVRTGDPREQEAVSSLCDARIEAVRAYLVAAGVSVEQIRALRSRLKPAECAAGAAEPPGAVVCEVDTAPAK